MAQDYYLSQLANQDHQAKKNNQQPFSLKINSRNCQNQTGKTQDITIDAPRLLKKTAIIPQFYKLLTEKSYLQKWIETLMGF